MTDRYRTDCAVCAALCCRVPGHERTHGFPEHKPADTDCRHLTTDRRCAIFERLEGEGYLVCRAYDCHGAGPLVTTWRRRSPPSDTARRDEDFRQLSRLHLLVHHLRGNDDPTAACLVDALDAVSARYQRTGRFDIDPKAQELLRANQSSVERILTRLAEPTEGG